MSTALGPYATAIPERFVIDHLGYAWAVWPDGHWSMVVSTPANYASTVVAEFMCGWPFDDTADA